MSQRPSPDLLRAVLRYDPETGVLYWRERPASMFKAGPKHSARHIAAKWNGQFAGQKAFGAEHTAGYRRGRLLGFDVYAHRAIWALVTGEWPAGDIDHINGDRADNRWSNLRSVDRLTNSRNATISRRNSTGVVGVHRHPTARWTASIGVLGRSVYLGAFKSFDAAVSARRAAERKYGFRDNQRRASL
jgi:hypothetical protein